MKHLIIYMTNWWLAIIGMMLERLSVNVSISIANMDLKFLCAKETKTQSILRMIMCNLISNITIRATAVTVAESKEVHGQQKL